ncbi:hypothetical protein Vadar_003505 [Vaccinium darrowii]|uniref:Uncharacterized protein n=1 Tax=Vaccinium darrowii TaxID=229202 RepID=A0ACB7Z1F5_9ERIC|nr:hypothetical protein Vadar_003505 [Vaccinium darrowii]
MTKLVSVVEEMFMHPRTEQFFILKLSSNGQFDTNSLRQELDNFTPPKEILFNARNLLSKETLKLHENNVNDYSPEDEQFSIVLRRA